jgi:hypothetical protein
MTRATVMAIDHQWATVFTEDCQLVKIPIRPDMAVGKEIIMEAQAKSIHSFVQSRSFKPALIAASLILLLAVGLIFGQGLLLNPVYAQVSIDINPSLELSLNRNLEVISVRAINEKAVQLLVGQDYIGLAWQEAVNRWTETVRTSNRFQVQTMLIAAVMPEKGELLRTQLLNMEGTQNQGTLANIAVRVIYSNDQAVANQAHANHLSVGRQMLLNQAQVQSQNYNAATISDAPLGDLIRNLLQDHEQDQTRLTTRTTQSLSDSTGATETNQVTSQAANQVTSQNANGSSQAFGTGTTETNRETNQNTSDSTQGSGTGTGTSETIQETNQETHQYTDGSTSTQLSGTSSQTSSSDTSQSQQTSQVKATNGQ